MIKESVLWKKVFHYGLSIVAGLGAAMVRAGRRIPEFDGSCGNKGKFEY
jgi:hypothetical protein